jgi:hypothetical protein
MWRSSKVRYLAENRKPFVRIQIKRITCIVLTRYQAKISMGKTGEVLAGLRGLSPRDDSRCKFIWFMPDRMSSETRESTKHHLWRDKNQTTHKTNQLLSQKTIVLSDSSLIVFTSKRGQTPVCRTSIDTHNFESLTMSVGLSLVDFPQSFSPNILQWLPNKSMTTRVISEHNGLPSIYTPRISMKIDYHAPSLRP